MTLRIENPATGALVTEVPSDSPTDVTAKVARARAAQPAWAARPIDERLEAIRRFRTWIVDDKERLAALTTSEVGKPLQQSRNELGGLLGRIDFFLENSTAVLADEVVLNDPTQKLLERIAHEPLGVVTNISAWNYPYFVGANAFLPALIAGNAVLYKPSELSTLTGLAMVEALHKSGVPADIMVPVVGAGDVGAAILREPIDGAFFTGSYATGAKIAEAAAKRIMTSQLELGGKDPVYVTDDVDVASAAAATADGAFYNCGQSCCAVERIYVHENVYDAFVEAFVAEVKGFKVGDPTAEGTYIGPMTRKGQLDVLDTQIADAKQKGATVLVGGARRAGPGNWYDPTVLTGVTHDMLVMKDESFGPVIGIMRVSSDEQALTLMNDTEYGLTAGVYGRDRDRARRILSRVNAGSAYWNCCDRVSPRLPWSGRGHSGLGVTLSKYGILAFTRTKAWHEKSV
ncbi:MAG TPA: aldehyde dehydrogenase family protein [Polyangiaceae bacterium]|jgi:acyl-CoA reductase-like NAD-dependent aldehyde dehydrogenase|nr:aldehyde dehydrogenase family protein [Polyangiaceae bacterium]